MKDISLIKEQLENLYCKKYCNIDSISECKNEKCTCSVAAEIKAYLQAVIPYPYCNLNIFDFNGMDSSGKIVLKSSKVKLVRDTIVKYCWGDIDIKKYESNKLDLDSLSIIDNRKKQCKNVSIYSTSDILDSTSKGKTFAAAIILKEAIKRRVIPEHCIDSYEWIQYNALKTLLTQDDDSLSNIKYADWLVVDDIVEEKHSKNAQGYICSLLDSFFYERVKEKLPTIFVFRFNIENKKELIEEMYGVSMGQIVLSDNTYVIKIG